MQENETGSLSNPIHKSKLEMNQRPECKSQNNKTFRRKHRQKSLEHSMSNFFLDMSPRARETKAKMNKWDYIKVKTSL